MKFEFSRQIFEESSSTKFHQNPSNGSRVVPCGQTDGHDEADSRFSQFIESLQKVGEYFACEVCFHRMIPFAFFFWTLGDSIFVSRE
jgi:hypothetical protein